MTASTGRLLAPASVRRVLRRTLSAYAEQIAERALAGALRGDGPSLLAVTQLLLAANGLLDLDPIELSQKDSAAVPSRTEEGA